MFGRKSFRGGVHPPEHKHLTQNKPIVTLPTPLRVVIPLSQHTGSPCRAIVAVGDEVNEGQKIGESTGFVSAPVHASIAGTVVAVESRPHPVLAFPVPSVVIESKPDATAATAAWTKNIDWRTLTAESIKDKIKEAGIVGMGGAAFPTHVKLSPPPGKTIRALLVNGAECEPYLTTDHRLMLERSDEILEGVLILLKALDIKTAVIGIEKNKTDAADLLREKIRRKEAAGEIAGDESVRVATLKVKYPQGAEKQLIKALLGREVPSGGLPFEVGVVVQNVGTAFAVYEAVVKDKPLIERVVTVSGDAVAEPANVLVRIGTSFRDLLAFAGGVTGSDGAAAAGVEVPGAEAQGVEVSSAKTAGPAEGAAPAEKPRAGYKMIMGGPMMGLAQYTLDAPVIKGTSGFLVLKQGDTKPSVACVKCGACVDRCPAGLMPYQLGNLSERNDFAACAEFNVKDCMECGVCSFVCPSARPLVHLIKYAKLNLAKQKK
ncbi:MAG: electron transport complex subunit RsxC [Spirochaetales bacterium]|nr:electron transport complex subunit RsxC [Spirochaetales bacterium]